MHVKPDSVLENMNSSELREELAQAAQWVKQSRGSNTAIGHSARLKMILAARLKHEAEASAKTSAADRKNSAEQINLMLSNMRARVLDPLDVADLEGIRSHLQSLGVLAAKKAS